MNKPIKHSLLLLCLLVLLSGCGGHPHIHPLTPSSVVLAFGDSLTLGAGAEPNQSYPALLADLIGCQVINAGHSGEVTPEGLRRLPKLMDEHKPNLVILCHGGNDLLVTHDLAMIRANLDGMIKLAQDRGADVILIGVPKPGLFLRAPSFYQALATKYDIPCDSKTVPKILLTPSLKSDIIHPNADGYQRMAQSLSELIHKSQ